MYVEVVVDRPIIKRDRRSFIETPQDAAMPYPETETLAEPDLPIQPDPNPLALTFHYHLPPHLENQIQIGQLVAVPFRTQQLPAIVVGLSDSSPVAETKPIAAILDPEPVLTPAQINLAYWLSRETLAPLAICLKYFLPPGSSRKPEWTLKPTPVAGAQAELNAPEQILLTYLRQHHTAPLAEVDQTAAEALIQKGLARKQATLGKPRVGPKLERMVELLIPPDEVEAVLPTLGHASKQADLLLYLANLDDPLPALADVLAQTDCSSKEQVKLLTEPSWVEIIPAQTRLAISPHQKDIIKAALFSQYKKTGTKNLSGGETEPPKLNTLIKSKTGQQIIRYLSVQKQPALIDEVITATKANRNHIYTLLKKGLIIRFDEPERIALTLPVEQLTEAIVQLRGAQKHAAVLRLLAEEDGPVWIGWVYAQTDATLPTLRDLAKAGLISLDEARRWRDPLAGRSFTLDAPPKLTAEQQTVWQEITRCWQPDFTDHRPVLLHGVTGSGKTEIYLQAMSAALKAGQGIIMLVPEITLATQTVERVSARFPGKVAVWHSALSPGERYDTWERVRAGELPIVVGPRSALFAPVKNLGVLVVDEEHEPVYKQRDRPPIFHAREAALELGRLSQALVIMGSATPDIVTYRRAERGEYKLLTLPTRILAHTKHLAVQQALIKRRKTAGGRMKPMEPATADGQPADFVALPLPEVRVVDLRDELKAGNRTIFSRALQDGIRETLGRGEQIILFLNRRGAASFVICRDCGYVMACPHCENTLTYHTSGELMVCHYCGYRARPAQVCPECQSERIRYFGLGTQRVEETVKKMFPQAQTIRWDWDTTRQKGSHDVFLRHFMAGQANVMVGTQMVAKGLDLPLVTLVGVISADTALYLPDFRAAERSFQLLMQVAGRAGRSPLGGRVIVQTYNPDQVAIEAAANHDYEGFYHTELAFRREQTYPPFKRLALLLYSGPGPERSAAEAQKLADRLRLYIERQGLPAVEIIGPTPAYVRRVRNQYRWHILLRAQDPAAILRPLTPLPQGWRVDIDPVTLL
ncbi:MAG: primosomal protein N' [Anaerolineae bacterium]|nr:primosomal protein N' [Anaerolineae bacterium]